MLSDKIVLVVGTVDVCPSPQDVMVSLLGLCLVVLRLIGMKYALFSGKISSSATEVFVSALFFVLRTTLKLFDIANTFHIVSSQGDTCSRNVSGTFPGQRT